MIHRYDTLESTNETAKELARAGAVHGTVVVARQQSAGKGQRGNSFFSPPDSGLYVSFVLRPEGSVLRPEGSVLDTPDQLTVWAARQVCAAIHELTDLSPRIKPVNDVLLDGKKVCGILTEAQTISGSSMPQWLVLGIGINVSTPADAFPPELRDKATSLFPDGDAPISNEQLLDELTKRIVHS